MGSFGKCGYSHERLFRTLHCLDEPPTTSSQAHTTMELFEPLNPMFAIGLDLPCKRIPAVELEVRDRDEMHLLSVVNAKIENARYTAFVTQVLHISDTTLMRKILLRTLLQCSPQPHGRKCTHRQRCLHSLHQCHGFFYVIDHGLGAQLDERFQAALETNAISQEVILDITSDIVFVNSNACSHVHL